VAQILEHFIFNLNIVYYTCVDS